VLNLNEYLTEAICLGHDIGHSPFGHTGEVVLNDLMRDYGGFEHNRQALRIVEFIEHPYPGFPGLNLTWETRRGLAKHRDDSGLPPSAAEAGRQVSLEAQIADLADRITYNTHDLEDGIRARIIEEPQLDGLDLLVEARARIRADKIADFVIRRTQLARAILDILISDAIETSRANIAAAGVQSAEDVYDCPAPLIALSREADEKLEQLEIFLRQNMYNHPSLADVRRDVETWLARLFAALCEDPSRMPTYYNRMIEAQGLERTVCDYIAGMTDRFAMRLVKTISREEP
jgi:dGTPase